ncbi:L-ascorbate metabolism protein UlaG (beta-lactamase superfamily) [Bisgaardia hudsonensis]|uniref:L-ascorbate metabolism protein UlaG (Beta-lactamase superfamily) n=1 Tax=Bisgaardia hudsonensis TaxID=109472 RepID=A0A4V2SJC7_9PAST|nr:MBL fold metallo-hydrolase [Bisgaardia hudsonensis]QLB12702.1 hypothetical protein A6A11_03320 [Bisgaardia hudsonensis]TCP14250.1 L-ascorbate metabolism protein UlaG (beta-lactamase superfamily) [Bisgaardia hudsonensis]
MLYLIGLILFVTLFYLLFVTFYPNFGANISKERKQLYRQSTQFNDGIFHNKTMHQFSHANVIGKLKIAYKFYFKKSPKCTPQHNLPIKKLDPVEVENYQGPSRLFWYGHSAFLLQIDGKNILLDPMLAKVAAPHKWLGSNRYHIELPLEIEDLPPINAVIFSHDHYDHLDYKSVRRLKDKTEHFFVPLGVGAHLEAWGITKEKITELDWWQTITYKGLELICTPAQHFSGRKVTNNMETLWCSWSIISPKERIFFSGDGGYTDQFKEIGNKFGPFDLALMECGQYDEMWRNVHMVPEESIQAGVDVQAKQLLPMHWATFRLALHSWTDPIERAKKKAEELNLPIITPMIGEEVIIGDTKKHYSQWWKSVE